MVSRSTKAPVPLGEYVPNADQRIVLYGVSWDAWESLLAIRGESGPRMAFLDGAVEIMSPSYDHELIKSNIGRMVETYCMERDITFTAVGAWLQKKKRRKAAAEPDECYVFGAHPKRKPRPDLAIEVAWTSGGLDKLEIYKRLEVAEVWFWIRGAISVHVLGERGYETRSRSACLPAIDLAKIAKLAVEAETTSAAVKRYRASLSRG